MQLIYILIVNDKSNYKIISHANILNLTREKKKKHTHTAYKKPDDIKLTRKDK